LKANAKIVWLGEIGAADHFTKNKRGHSYAMTKVTFHSLQGSLKLTFPQAEAKWLMKMLSSCSADQGSLPTAEQLKLDFERHMDNFELFWDSKSIGQLRERGLLLPILT